MTENLLHISAPGRICLLGEHQDYFGLPVIAAAINLRIWVRGTPRDEPLFKISLRDTKEIEEFSLEKELPYTKERDYLKSSINALRREGVHWSHGWDCDIHGTIPINSGTASSSALVVAWIKFLLESAQEQRAHNPETIAELAFLSEVAEFKEPGGRMDHYSSALGKVVGIHFGNGLKIKRFNPPLREFILADSLQRKDTTGVLGTIKSHVLTALSKIQTKSPSFTLHSPVTPDEQKEIEELPGLEKRLLKGTLLTRSLTAEAETLLHQKNFDHRRFGRLLTRQHEVMRDYLQVSSPKLEKMVQESLSAGALGAKINGSGGGGCIVVYAPQKTEEVAEALRKLNVRVSLIRVDEGVKREKG
ncbi:hypothetical protein KGY73_06205 [bacterium]|nr:hypothetical protein [bacterium]